MEARLTPLPGTRVAGQTPLDVASGYTLGTVTRPALPAAAGPLHDTFLRATAAHMRPGRPYFVAFSGGPESSVDLALATCVARRGGFPDPIPVTLRYEGVTGAGEVSAQERVVAHLGLRDWERVVIRDELQLVGPVAQRVLRDVGLLWPPNAHSMLPLMERARGGAFSLMAGVADFFVFWPWGPLAEVLRAERRPRRHDLALAAMALTPPALRAAAARRRGRPAPMPWLRPDAERRARQLMSRRSAAPLRFARAARVQSTHRCLHAVERSLGALAATAGTELVQVLFDSRSVAAFAAAGGGRGRCTARGMLEGIAGGLLPRQDETPGTTDLRAVLFGAQTRAFAARWSGDGLDESLVDPERLRAMWTGRNPDWRTAGLLQTAWLHDEGGERGAAGEPVATAA